MLNDRERDLGIAGLDAQRDPRGRWGQRAAWEAVDDHDEHALWCLAQSARRDILKPG